MARRSSMSKGSLIACLCVARVAASSIHKAAAAGDVQKLRQGLDHGLDVDEMAGKMKFCALHLASLQGHTDAVQMLLDHGASTSIRDSKGYTALHMAAAKGELS